MEINILAVIVATIAMFAVGGLWYMVLFQKQWSKMHDMDKLTDKQLEEMSAKMGPYYGLQLLMTILSAWVLVYVMNLLPDMPPVLIAVLMWAGFVLPMSVSGVIFGGTKSKYILSKILIQSGETLVRLIVAAWGISLF